MVCGLNWRVAGGSPLRCDRCRPERFDLSVWSQATVNIGRRYTDVQRLGDLYQNTSFDAR